MTKPFEDISTLLSLIHTGDWDKTSAAINAVTEGPIPDEIRELSEYRRRLRDTLVAARAARANLAADLARTQAGQRVSLAYHSLADQTPAYQSGTHVPERSAGPNPG